MSEADFTDVFGSASSGHTSADSGAPVVLTAQALANAIARYCQRGLAIFPLAPGKKTPATPHSFKDAGCDLVHTLEVFLTSVAARRVPGYFDALKRRRDAGAGNPEHDAAEVEVMRLWAIAKSEADKWGIAKAADPVAAFVRAIGRRAVPNLAVATGAPSGGACVLDVDEKEGKHGEATLAALEAQHSKVPDSHAITTASGGRHLWLAGGASPLRSSQGYIDAKGKAHGLGSGLDTKGTGGYAVAWPTVVKGKQYSPIPDGPLPVVLQWLHDELGAPRVNGTDHPGVDNSELWSGIGRDWSETPENVAQVRTMLAVLPADDYMLWRDVGMAVKSLRWQCGEEMFGEWSQTSDKYDDAGFERLWNSIKPDGGISIGTLWHWATEAGWVPPNQAKATDASSGDTQASESQNIAGGRFIVDARGVWFIAIDKDGTESDRSWVSSPLHIVADTRDGQGGSWGRLVRWGDRDGTSHEWALPMAELQGDGLAVRQRLADGGTNIAPGRIARDRLLLYLQCWQTGARARCVDALGWHGRQFVTGGRLVGQSAQPRELTVLQSTYHLDVHYGQAGTIHEWVERIGRKAHGNYLLRVALCAAFAAPMIALLDVEAFALHLMGDSSQGKSITGYAAASVYGPRGGVRKWHSTKNGLEAICAAHTDSLLVLDEINEADPMTVGETTYMIASGIGKGRMEKSRTAQKSLRWRTIVLSTGEDSLEVLMRAAGKSVKPGMLVRLVHLPADAGAGLGSFGNVHGATGPQEFADKLKRASAEVYGSVGLAWLEKLTRFDAIEQAREFMSCYVTQIVPGGVSPQVRRVAAHFAALAFAGELATAAGLTGWLKGEAARDCARAFKTWLAAHGPGQREETLIVAEVARFFEQFGSSRFEELNGKGEVQYGKCVSNRAGFRRELECGAWEYLVLGQVFEKDLCKGFDARRAAKALKAAGMLIGDQADRSTTRARLPGFSKQVRVYRFVSIVPTDEDKNGS